MYFIPLPSPNFCYIPSTTKFWIRHSFKYIQRFTVNNSSTQN